MPLSYGQRLKKLQAAYRGRWDAHQLLADRNARLLHSGQQPSNEQLINEQRAAEAVALARKELVAALSENLIDESGDEAASEARIGRSAPVLGH